MEPRHVLRPGLHVVRRDDGHLQVGLDAPYRLVVEDDPDVRRVLADLRAARRTAPVTPAGHRLLVRLLDLELLVEADLLDAALERVASAGGERAAVLACFARHGNGAAVRLEARSGATVALDLPGSLAPTTARLLRAAGVVTVPAVGATDTGRETTAALIVSAGEPSRSRVDPLVRAGLPYLLLSGGAFGTTLGPFVVPGVTACLRCLDAHRGERDPRRATVLEQCARADTDRGPDDLAQVSAALAWAVTELVAFVDGDRPTTWSATLTWTGDPVPRRRSWPRHPHCGCAWDALPSTG